MTSTTHINVVALDPGFGSNHLPEGHEYRLDDAGSTLDRRGYKFVHVSRAIPFNEMVGRNLTLAQFALDFSQQYSLHQADVHSAFTALLAKGSEHRCARVNASDGFLSGAAMYWKLHFGMEDLLDLDMYCTNVFGVNLTDYQYDMWVGLHGRQAQLLIASEIQKSLGFRIVDMTDGRGTHSYKAVMRARNAAA